MNTSQLHLSLLVDSSLVVASVATSGIKVSQARREIVCRFQRHWWLFGGDRVLISGAALGLFVGLCVDLKIAFGLLKESNLVE